MSYTLDTPVADLEFSVRVQNVLANHGCRTLRDAAAKLEQLKEHARGFGHKGYREVKEAIQYASQTQGDLLQQEEYRRYLLEDRLTTVMSLLQSVEHRLLNAALKGHMGREARRDAAFKLRDAANYVEQIPLQIGED
jgi:hypothetical protein